MKKLVISLLLAGLVAASLSGCTEKPVNNDEIPVPGPDASREEWEEYIESIGGTLEINPEGEITEIWFDEVFGAFYPKQLKDIYFTKTYMYGEAETEQPVLGLCSEKLTEIKFFSVADGELSDEIFAIDELLPMEAVLLYVELSEQADLAVTFKDEAGEPHTVTLSRNADDSEVVFTELTK